MTSLVFLIFLRRHTYCCQVLVFSFCVLLACVNFRHGFDWYSNGTVCALYLSCFICLPCDIRLGTVACEAGWGVQFSPSLTPLAPELSRLLRGVVSWQLGGQPSGVHDTCVTRLRLRHWFLALGWRYCRILVTSVDADRHWWRKQTCWYC